jgi:hypothetical protein
MTLLLVGFMSWYCTYFVVRGGTKIAIPSNSIDVQKSYHPSSDLLNTDNSNDGLSIKTLIELFGTKIHGLRW